MERSIRRVGILDAGSDTSRDLQRWLLQRGYLADIMQDAKSMETYCTKLNPAALIMDMGPDGADNVDLIARLRVSGHGWPIIAMIEGQDDALKVRALQTGADDFMEKSTEKKQFFDRLELIFHQRVEQGNAPAYSATDDLDDVLTKMEQRILRTLEQHMPDPRSREQIMWEVKRQHIAPEDRSVDVYISNIRRKLRLVNSSLAIETVRGVGFMLSRHHA